MDLLLREVEEEVQRILRRLKEDLTPEETQEEEG